MKTSSAIGVFTWLTCMLGMNALAQECGVPQDRSAFVPFDPRVFWLEGKHNSWKPTEGQVEAAECILKQMLLDQEHGWRQKLDSAYFVEDHSSARGSIEIYWHYRQYSGATNGRGDNIICINAFCDPMPNWRHRFVWVLDGGDCYWQAVINLSTKEVEMFEVNGDA